MRLKPRAPKVSQGVRLSPQVYDAISRLALERRWSQSQATDELLKWCVAQLERAGSFDALMASAVQLAAPEKKKRALG